ncbi:MAG: hypothetical protein KC420_02645, partial [Myxococcales bacterium]|nr:hypothetical protein [Myxococcales bacterium]
PPPVAIAGVGRRLRRPEAAVNHDHPHLQALVKLRARDPAMAAYCLAKDLLLAEDRRLDLDGPLMAAALPGHARRFDAKEARR